MPLSCKAAFAEAGAKWVSLGARCTRQPWGRRRSVLAGTLVVGGAHCAGQPWSRWGFSARRRSCKSLGLTARRQPCAVGCLGDLARGSVLDGAPRKVVYAVPCCRLNTTSRGTKGIASGECEHKNKRHLSARSPHRCRLFLLSSATFWHRIGPARGSLNYVKTINRSRKVEMSLESWDNSESMGFYS